MSCKELTGDSTFAETQEIDNADIICTTPEKFGKGSTGSDCPLQATQPC